MFWPYPQIFFNFYTFDVCSCRFPNYFYLNFLNKLKKLDGTKNNIYFKYHPVGEQYIFSSQNISANNSIYTYLVEIYRKYLYLQNSSWNTHLCKKISYDLYIVNIEQTFNQVNETTSLFPI